MYPAPTQGRVQISALAQAFNLTIPRALAILRAANVGADARKSYDADDAMFALSIHVETPPRAAFEPSQPEASAVDPHKLVKIETEQLRAARLRQMIERDKRNFIGREQAIATAQEIVRRWKSAALAIAPRIAPLCVNQPDEAVIRDIIQGEIRRVLLATSQLESLADAA